MLSVQLRHTFDGFDLDVTFDAPKGITVLYGRSGTGKSTIINAVAGLLHPDAGRVSVQDKLLFDTSIPVWLPAHKRRVGYIFQDARLFPHLSVRNNLIYGQRFAPRGAPCEDLERVVDILGIAQLLDRRPTLLSGGEKQRVAIGRALLAAPQIILADEPLAALDDARKAEIMPYFERLRDEVQVPILYVSHSAAEVARLATTVVALQNGRVSGSGPAADILSDPDVNPLGVRAAGAMLNARLIKHHQDGLSELDAGGARLLLPKVDFPPGADLRVRIEAQDVMLALDKPTGISALNVLAATIRTLRQGDGPGVLVQLDMGSNIVLARITRRSAKTLDLHPGKPVFAVIKAVSVPHDAVGDLHEVKANL